MTQRSLYHQSPPQHGKHVTFKSEPGAHCFQAVQQVKDVLSRCLLGTKPLPGSIGFCFSGQVVWPQAAFLLFKAPPVWPSDFTAQLLLFTLAGRGLVNLISFPDFLKVFELFTFLLELLPCRIECFYL